MAGYTLQGKTETGSMVDIPLAATYDSAGNSIVDYYAAKTEYENMMAKLATMDEKLNVVVGITGDSSLEGASWSTISSASKAGLASTLWKVGDEKKVTLSTGEEITLVILGFNHDDKSDGTGKAGITFGMKNALATAYPINSTNTNVGGWTSSVMRTTTMATLLGYLPTEVQEVITPVNKLTSAGNLSSTINTTEDKLFLFSMEEIMGTHMYSTTTQYAFSGEGTQYEYYKNAPLPTPTSGTGTFTALNGGSTGTFYTTDTAVASGYTDMFGTARTTTANRYYNYNNAKARGDSATSASFWWLRSPRYSNSSGFCYVNSDGYVIYNGASSSYGVAFGFCI